MVNSQFITDTEVWKAIPDYPGYEVSDRGRIRSFKRKAGRHYNLADTPQRILQPAKTTKGYLIISLCKNGRGYSFKIHRLVLSVFVGPRPFGMEGCHYDGNRANNFLENLRWDTRCGNEIDAKRHGSRKGINRSHPKLTEAQVIQIRELPAQGYSQRGIGKIFSISHGHVFNIISRRIWKHIP